MREKVQNDNCNSSAPKGLVHSIILRASISVQNWEAIRENLERAIPRDEFVLIHNIKYITEDDGECFKIFLGYWRQHLASYDFGKAQLNTEYILRIGEDGRAKALDFPEDCFPVGEPVEEALKASWKF